MAKKRLNPKEIDQLLTQYRSERRRLMFQLETVREAIRGLKEVRGDNTVEGDETLVKRGPGRPRKTDAEGAVARKSGRRKRRVRRRRGETSCCASGAAAASGGRRRTAATAATKMTTTTTTGSRDAP